MALSMMASASFPKPLNRAITRPSSSSIAVAEPGIFSTSGPAAVRNALIPVMNSPASERCAAKSAIETLSGFTSTRYMPNALLMSSTAAGASSASGVRMMLLRSSSVSG